MNVGPIRIPRLAAVISRELRELSSSRVLIFTLMFVPLVLVALALAVDWVILGTPTQAAEAARMPLVDPRVVLTPQENILALLHEQSLTLLLIVSTALPSAIASHAVVGEKMERTLEPVLATPVATYELLLGKCCVAILPSILATWLAYGVTLIGIAQMTSDRVLALAMREEWVWAFGMLAPELSLTAALIACIASSRVADPRTAQGLTSFLLIPILGGGISSLLGILKIDIWRVGGAVAFLGIVDLLLVRVAAWLFDRERILTRWR